MAPMMKATATTMLRTRVRFDAMDMKAASFISRHARHESSRLVRTEGRGVIDDPVAIAVRWTVEDLLHLACNARPLSDVPRISRHQRPNERRGKASLDHASRSRVGRDLL